MSKTMDAQVLVDTEKLERKRLPVPDPGQSQVRVRIVKTGICGSDVTYFFVRGSIQPPRVLGHETCGYVDAVGPGVKGLAVGDRVVVNPVQSDPKSPWTKIGLGNVDLSSVTGITYDGGFGEYCLSLDYYTYKLPAKVSFDQAVSIEPAACGLYAIKNANIQKGATVAIVGPGPIGILMCQMAKAMGAGKAVLIGTRDYRLKKASGADALINTSDVNSKFYAKDPVEAVKNLNGGQLPRSVIVATNSKAGKELGWKLGGGSSTVVFFGLPVADDRFTINELEAMLLDKTLRWSWLSPNTWEGTIKLIEEGKLDVREIQTHHAGIADLEKYLRMQKAREGDCIKTIIEMSRE